MVIDYVVRQSSGGELAFDEDGRLAAVGTVHAGLLAELLRHPYLALRPPRPRVARSLASSTLRRCGSAARCWVYPAQMQLPL